MLIYTLRKYREESRLPLDMKNPIPYLNIIPLWDCLRSEFFNVQKKHYYMEPIPDFYRLTEVTPFGEYYRLKKNMINEIATGTVIAVVLVSKIFSFIEESHKSELFSFSTKYRVFYGHCIWKRNSVLLLRMFLVRTHFIVRLNLYAPNLLVLACITPKAVRRKERSSFLYILKKNRYFKRLSHKKPQR